MFFGRRLFNRANLLVEVNQRQLGVPVAHDNRYLSHDSVPLANFVPHLVMGWTGCYLTHTKVCNFKQANISAPLPKSRLQKTLPDIQSDSSLYVRRWLLG